MNIEEILAAVSAAEELVPLIEKGFTDIKVVVADIETAFANIKAKITGVKALAVAAAVPPASTTPPAG